MTVCDGLDVTRETCHSNTAWCVMNDATFYAEDKNSALARLQTCVARRIFNPDGDVSTQILYNEQNRDTGPHFLVFCVN